MKRPDFARGRVVRAVLGILRRHERRTSALRAQAEGLDTLNITAQVYGLRQPHFFKPVRRAHEVAVRRALAKLVREGLVIDLGVVRAGHRKHWRAAPKKCDG